ncbi:TrlF family AAA-like ATPase [Shewanella frigidimarina]|uniref:TrlF family AAA-like ATPase n=1 Tax=Shewanella frigidimarina TaxID=56812 RepID=UPI003D7A377C
MIGSLWGKWDLHMHSPLTHQNNQFNVSMEEYVDKLNEQGLSLVGVTNYFFFEDNELEIIRSKIKEKAYNINILGNIEFRISQPNKDNEFINVHCIFAEHLTTSQINGILSKLRLKNTTSSGGDIYCEKASISQHGIKVDHIFIDYEDLQVHLSKNLKRGVDYLMVACPNGYGGFRPDLKEGRSLAIAKEIDKFGDLIFGNSEEDRTFFLSDRKSGFPPKPVFACSDSHDIKMIGSSYSWVKAKTTFEGLRQVLIEPEERIQITDNFIEKIFEKPHFKSLTLKGYIFPGQPLQFKEGLLPLNPNMAAIIGGRGTGKSILLDSIRSKFPNNPVSPGLRSVNVDGLSITLNQGNGSTLEFNQSENVYSYLHVSQGDIQHATQKPDELSNQIKLMLGLHDSAFTPIQATRIQDSLAKYRAYIDYRNTKDNQGNYINNEGHQQSVTKYNKDLISTLTSPQNKELIEKYQQNIQKINLLNQFITLCNQTATSIDQAISSLNTSLGEINTNPLLLTHIPLIDFSPSSIALLTNIEQANKSLLVLTDENVQIVEEFKKQGINQDIASLLTKVNECQTQIDSAASKLDEIKSKNIEYFELIENRKAFATTYKDYLTIKESQIIGAYTSLCEPKETWNYEQNQLVKDILTDINIYGSITFNLDLFYTGMLNCINRGKFRETSTQTAIERLKQTFNVNNLESFFRLLMNEDVISIPEESQLISLESFCWKQEYFNQSGRFELLDYLYKPNAIQIYLHVNAEFKYKGKTVDKLSVGQRGTFYVCLKLATDPFGSPFIFDQPEDDLDNDFIMKQLVPLFRKIKKYRQVIIVTHNANLVVNSDAEQIIIANNEGEIINYYSGAVEDGSLKDKNSIRAKICDILEGGGYAFEQRERKYGLAIHK